MDLHRIVAGHGIPADVHTASCMFMPPESSHECFKLMYQNPFLLRALQASLTVVFMTLALFFASGMYEEKIRYAHR